MTPEQESLKEFLNKIASPLDAIFEDEQFISPMWFIDSGDNLTIIATPWADDNEKRQSVGYVKAKMKELNATRFCQIAEVWTFTAPEDEGVPESIKAGASIASHPDRREAVVAIAEDKLGNAFRLLRYILRPEHGKATLSPPEIIEYGQKHSEGLLTGLLRD